MQVRMLTGLSGPLGAWSPGDIYECSAAEGARLIEAGFAEAIAVPVERAVQPAAPVRRTKKR